jgi:hypothetical protein
MRTLRTALISIVFAMTTTSLFSQHIYPQRLVVEGDTIVGITPTQLREVNYQLLERDTYIRYMDSLMVSYQADIDKLAQRVSTRDTMIALQRHKIDLMKADNNTAAMQQTILSRQLAAQRSKTMRYTLAGSAMSVLITGFIYSLFR